MGKVDDIRRRMRGIQTDYAADTGQNLHQEAALGVALAEQQGADETEELAADSKLVAKKAKTDAKSDMISTGVQVLSGPIGAIAKGKAGGGLIGAMKKGKGGDVTGGGELTKGQQRRADRRAARQAKREERRGGGPKVKGGLFAPLFTGGRVDTKGQWTEKGMKAQADAGKLTVEKKGWGSDEPPPVTVTKNPLYKPPSAPKAPKPTERKDPALFAAGSADAAYSDKTRKFANIFMLPENQNRLHFLK